MPGERSTGPTSHSYRDGFEDRLTANFRSSGSGTLFCCNRTFARLFGFPSHTAVRGQRLRARFLDEESWQGFIEALQDEETVQQDDLVLKRSDGKLVHVAAAIEARLQADHELLEIRGSFFDLTHFHDLEKRLEQAQRFEAVGRLASGIAHDFNNLLTTINGYTELLQLQLTSGIPGPDAVGEIKRASHRAAELANQLSSFSRRQMARPSPLDLNTVVARIDGLLRRLLREGIALQTELTPDLGSVRADRAQIEQIILNLVLNASDAMSGSGRIRLETSNRHLEHPLFRQGHAVPAGDYAVLRVTDSKASSDPVGDPTIGLPFASSGESSGLGLAMVRDMVGQCNGYVFVEGLASGGATIEIYLASEESDASHFRPRDARFLPKRPSQADLETILLVEDEEPVREFASEVLAMRGYSLLTARNGAEALNLLRRHIEIALIVTDVMMPVMNGSELAQQASRIRPDVKVLFLSGYTGDALGQHGILECDAALLRKPFTPRDLSSKVRDMLLVEQARE